MFLYAAAGFILILSLLVIIFALKSDDIAVRSVLAFISIIPWIILIIFLSAYGK